MKSSNIEFVSYDGKWPNLCSGTLVFKVDGKEYVAPQYCLRTGGCANWRTDEIIREPWTVDMEEFPGELKQYKEEITDMVNANIPYGCCGGCI